MKRRLPIPLLAAALALALAACNAPDTSVFRPYTNVPAPSPGHSELTFTARPDELAIGSQPFAQLTPETVRSIRITIIRDSQPTDWPDPCKILDTKAALTPVLTYLQSVAITDSSAAHPDKLFTAVPGATALGVDIELTDGSTSNYCFNQMQMYAGYSYTISAAKDLVALYESLPIAEFYPQIGNVLTSSSKYNDDDIFIRRGADIPQGPCSVGQLIRREDGEETVLHEWVSLSPFFFEKSDDRIVFAGYPGGDTPSLESVRYYSMDENGGDLKELDAKFHDVESPIWFNDMIYYVGWTQDNVYPKPLNSARADFTRHIKVMDIPGPLVGISINGGGVYCLSADRKSLLRMPDTVVKSFPAPIQQVAYIQAYNQYTFTDSSSKEHNWNPD